MSQGNREIEGAQRNLDTANALYRSVQERKNALVEELSAVESRLKSAKQRRLEALSFLKDAERRHEVIHIDACEEEETEKCTPVAAVAHASARRDEEESSEDDDSDYEPSRFHNVVTPPKKKRRADASRSDATEASRRLGLDEEGPAWLEDFHQFLLLVPHGDGNTKKVVSKTNARTVLNKVRKLTTGTGVTYRQWPAGTVFAKDRPVDMSTDFSALYQEAVAFEEKHGKDKGHGWLLLHPIKKMQLYASHVQARPS